MKIIMSLVFFAMCVSTWAHDFGIAMRQADTNEPIMMKEQVADTINHCIKNLDTFYATGEGISYVLNLFTDDAEYDLTEVDGLALYKDKKVWGQVLKVQSDYIDYQTSHVSMIAWKSINNKSITGTFTAMQVIRRDSAQTTALNEYEFSCKRVNGVWLINRLKVVPRAVL